MITTPLSSLLGSSAYGVSSGNPTSVGDSVYLTSSSSSKGSGNTGYTYTNGNSNDYNSVVANSPIDIGAVQYNSCTSGSTSNTTGFCSINSQCCASSCNSYGFCASSGGGGGSSSNIQSGLFGKCVLSGTTIL